MSFDPTVEHLPLGVNKAGDGPVMPNERDFDHWECFCGQPGCTKWRDNLFHPGPHSDGGKVLFQIYGEDVLGPWDEQSPEVQQAWRDIANRVSENLMLSRAMNKLLDEEAK